MFFLSFSWAGRNDSLHLNDRSNTYQATGLWSSPKSLKGERDDSFPNAVKDWESGPLTVRDLT